eukprot:COSAG01_NODE_23318_length_819_cov_4.440278_2_plen_122_part_00
MEPNPYSCMIFQQGTCSLRLIAVPEARICLLSVRQEPAELAYFLNLVLRTQKFILLLRRFQSYRANRILTLSAGVTPVDPPQVVDLAAHIQCHYRGLVPLRQIYASTVALKTALTCRATVS